MKKLILIGAFILGCVTVSFSQKCLPDHLRREIKDSKMEGEMVAIFNEEIAKQQSWLPKKVVTRKANKAFIIQKEWEIVHDEFSKMILGRQLGATLIVSDGEKCWRIGCVFFQKYNGQGYSTLMTLQFPTDLFNIEYFKVDCNCSGD